MASETATQADAETETTIASWQAGIAGGIVGGIVFGIMMTMQMPMIMENAIPGMYGLGPEALGIGWIIHLIHSIILGLVFGLILQIESLSDQLDTNLKLGVAGLVYGIILWIVLASFVMPAWVGAMTPMEPPVPQWNMDSLMGHAVYGVLLGIVYAVLSR